MNCLLCNQSVEGIITNKLRDGSHRRVFWCSPCKLGILDSQESQEKVEKYYKEDYRKESSSTLNSGTDPEKEFESQVNFQESRLDLINPYINKNSTVLDIGCSSGMFMYHLKDKVKEIIGIDFDITASEYASKKCNCKTYSTDITETPIEEESIDVICCFQTLEHLKEPIKFINTIKKYLKKDGKIMIEVPNTNDAMIYTYDLPNHFEFYFHKAHLYYFTEDSLKRLFDKTELSGDFHYTQDYNIFNHFNWLMNDKPQPNGMFGLSDPNFELKNNSLQINSFFKRINNEYKMMLKQLKISSNIVFIGGKDS